MVQLIEALSPNDPYASLLQTLFNILTSVVLSFSSEASCKKREDYLEWPEYFMAVAFLSAQRSKDPSSQVGACIVNSENKIVGIGYNGMPNGCSDDALPWTRTGANRLDTKYPYVCHAELNAIMNKNSADVKGCSMYVALFPCNECAKLIIQAGIKEVIFMSDKYHDTIEMTAARRMFDLAGVIYREFKPKCNKIIIDFDSINGRPSQKLL
uniref:Deoxycytidylate deaminase n=2 Tax=Ficedula albicollis TaxID=59894 RepID=A0A803W7C4_FICAL